ncbi:hypothetical protein D3C76_1555420 [compost metagenome]
MGDQADFDLCHLARLRNGAASYDCRGMPIQGWAPGRGSPVLIAVYLYVSAQQLAGIELSKGIANFVQH